MQDFKETLESIRELSKTRVREIKGATYYNDKEKTQYLQQYEAKLRELDRLLHDFKPLCTASRET